jgi:hypothetical protein
LPRCYWPVRLSGDSLPSMSWTDLVTLGIAVLGAGLGLLNTWQSWHRDRLRLRVTPVNVVSVDGRFNFGIEIANLSTFPVSLNEVGFTLDGRSARRGDRMIIPSPIPGDGGPWPRRLEAREAMSLYFDGRGVEASRIGRAYVKTASGEFVYGSSGALTNLRAGIN